MGLDRAARGGDCHAGQHQPCRDLVFTEDELVLLIHIATDQLAGAGGAGSSTAGEGKIDGLLGCCIQNRLVIGAVDRLIESLAGIDGVTLSVAMEEGRQDPRFETGFLQPDLMGSAWPSLAQSPCGGKGLDGA